MSIEEDPQEDGSGAKQDVASAENSNGTQDAPVVETADGTGGSLVGVEEPNTPEVTGEEIVGLDREDAQDQAVSAPAVAEEALDAEQAAVGDTGVGEIDQELGKEETAPMSACPECETPFDEDGKQMCDCEIQKPENEAAEPQEEEIVEQYDPLNGAPMRLSDMGPDLIALEAPSDIIKEMIAKPMDIPDAAAKNRTNSNATASSNPSFRQESKGGLVPPQPEKKYYISQTALYKHNCNLLKVKYNSRVLSLLSSSIEPVRGVPEYNFERVYLGDKGLLALIAPLELNRNFSTLRLKGNGIHNRGIVKLADMLLDHAALTRLDVSDNFISDEGAKALLKLVQRNKNLVELDYQNKFSPDVKLYKSISSIVSKNQAQWKEMLGMKSETMEKQMRRKKSVRRATVDKMEVSSSK